MPTRLRSSVTSSVGSLMSVPPIRILPATRTPSIRSFIRFRQRSSVDLPQPEGPMYAVTRCLATDIETSLRASLSPYQSETWSISTIGASMILAALAWGLRLAATGTWVDMPFSSSSRSTRPAGPQPRDGLRLAPLDRRHRVRPAQAVAQPDREEVHQHDDPEQQERRDEHHRARCIHVRR